MPVRKRERGSGMWGASRTVGEAGVWWAGQCGRPGLVGGARTWRGGAVVSRCGRSAPHWGGHGPALGQETGYWGRRGPALGWAWTGIGVGNGLLGQARTSIGVGMDWHWGRKRAIGVGMGRHWGGHGLALG